MDEPPQITLAELAASLGVEWPPPDAEEQQEDLSALTPKARLRLRLWQRDGGICQLCARPLPLDLVTLDRIIPGALGGTYVQENVWIACARCNQRKGNQQLPRFAYASPGRLRAAGLDRHGLPRPALSLKMPPHPVPAPSRRRARQVRS